VNRLRINVVVTCTARKTKPVPAGARLMNVAGATIAMRFMEWRRRLDGARADQIKAIDLYCGNAWSVVRRLYEDPETGPRVRLWIVSAGQGLLSPETLVVPYAATFSRGHVDSVLPEAFGQEEAEQWWHALVKWRRGNGQKLASIVDVACAFPGDPLIVAASEEYLSALHTDLEAARMCLRRLNGMVIISSGARKTGPLAGNFLPCDSRFEHAFGRGRMTLNVKILWSVVAGYSAGEISIGKLRGRYQKILDGLPEAPYPTRVRMTDEDVRKFIRRQLRIQPTAGHTRLLRSLRDSGTACEQERFRELYRKVEG
jgi:hypothetical protein